MSNEYRKRFLDIIQNSEKEAELCPLILSNIDNIIEVCIADEVMETIAFLVKHKKIYIWGAYEIADNILFLQRILHLSCIVGMCDNDKNKQGKYYQNYLIEKPVDVVSQHTDAAYIVCARKSGPQMLEYLADNGIQKEKCMIRNTILDNKILECNPETIAKCVLQSIKRE